MTHNFNFLINCAVLGFPKFLFLILTVANNEVQSDNQKEKPIISNNEENPFSFQTFKSKAKANKQTRTVNKSRQLKVRAFIFSVRFFEKWIEKFEAKFFKKLGLVLRFFSILLVIIIHGK